VDWEVSVKFILSALLVIATTLGCTAAERILMTRLGPSQSSLFVSNADGNGEQKVTEGSLDYDPVWSPDGQWIVFTSERDGSADLYRMRPDGSGVEPLTDDPAYDDQAAFSPDGSRSRARQLADEAVAELEPLGSRAERLRELALALVEISSLRSQSSG